MSPVKRMSKRSERILMMVAACTAVLPAQTQTPLVPDRPEFTATSTLVGKGFVEFDDGFTFSSQANGYELSAPETMVRLGLNDRLELRLDGDGFLSEWNASSHAKGPSDGEVSAKVGLFGQRHLRPSVSIISSVSMPTGGPQFSSRSYDPTVKVAWDKDLVSGFAAGGNFNLSSITTSGGRIAQKAASFSLSHGLGADFGLFGEVYAVSPVVAGNPALWSGDGGVTRSIGKNAQVDVRFGKQINSTESTWLFGAGFTIREPMKWISH